MDLHDDEYASSRRRKRKRKRRRQRRRRKRSNRRESSRRAREEECEEEDKEVTRLDIDLLGVEFLVDLLALVETTNKKGSQASQLNGVELEGIIGGFDPVYQTYTFVEGDVIYFVHEGQNNYDIGIDTSAGTYLYIDNAGVIMEVSINGSGDNVIIINQSP